MYDRLGLENSASSLTKKEFYSILWECVGCGVCVCGGGGVGGVEGGGVAGRRRGSCLL